MRILVAPLDWGLGHASRCVPLIQELLQQGVEPVLASAGPALILLRKEFPDLPAEPLPPYGIRYPTGNMMWNMAIQIPKLRRAIRAEKKAAAELVKKYHIRAIISDNRFGCMVEGIRNIFITHQLHILPPPRWSFLSGQINKWNHDLIQRFDECWIPDIPGPGGLSGILSQGALRIPIYFLGYLSRMQTLSTPPTYVCGAVLSGPEPQRSRLEAILRPQLRALGLPCLLVQGIMEESFYRQKEGLLEVVPYLTGRELNAALVASELIIARSGYSTLMDLAALRKKSLLIPTPGQTEQIYLAARLAERGLAFHQKQDQVLVEAAVAQMPAIRPLDLEVEDRLLLKRIAGLMEQLG